MTNPDPDRLPPSDSANAVAGALLAIAEMMVPVAETLDAYRDSLVSRGYNDLYAQQMTADYHAALMRMIIK